MKFTERQKKLRKRLMEVVFKANASHIGSSISVIDIIDSIFEIKSSEDRFVLSNGHAAAAYYVVLEKNNYLKNIDLNTLGVHPDRDLKKHIHVSTGSLGQGLPIALGMALADKKKTIYCLISDGECAEGSIWEALRVYQQEAPNNLKIVVSVNGWGAYDKISSRDLKKRFTGFGLKVVSINGHDQNQIVTSLKEKYDKPTLFFAKTNSDQLPFLKDLVAHYHSMSEEEYQLAVKKFS